MMVDDQNYVSVLIYIAQYGKEDPDDIVYPEDFEWMYKAALAFVLGPYFVNLWSSIRITQKISSDGTVSSFSKQYFQNNSHIYTLLVLLSGGSFRALSLMNSNLFGLRILSAGLSTMQIQQFQTYHVA